MYGALVPAFNGTTGGPVLEPFLEIRPQEAVTDLYLDDVSDLDEATRPQPCHRTCQPVATAPEVPFPAEGIVCPPAQGAVSCGYPR